MSESDPKFIEAKQKITELSKILNKNTDDGKPNQDRPTDLTSLETLLDEENNLIMVGATNASTLPVRNAFQHELTGDEDGFVATLNPNGEIKWCSYLGGIGNEALYDVYINDSSNIVVTGLTNSMYIPSCSEDSFADQNQLFQATITPEGKFLNSRFSYNPDLDFAQLIYNFHIESNDNGHLIMAAINEVSLDRLKDFPLFASVDNLKEYSYGLIKTNSKLQVQWIKMIPATDITRVTDFFEEEATQQTFIAGYHSTKANQDATVMCIDSKGELLWKNEWDDGKVSDLYAMHIDHENHSLIAYIMSEYENGEEFKHKHTRYRIKISKDYSDTDQWTGEELAIPPTLSSIEFNHYARNSKGSLAIESKPTVFDSLDDLLLVDAYQEYPFGTKDASDIHTVYLRTIDPSGKVHYATFYGGTERMSSLFPRRILLTDTGILYMTGFINNLDAEDLSYIGIDPAIHEMRNRLAFVTTFDENGQQNSIILFGLESE